MTERDPLTATVAEHLNLATLWRRSQAHVHYRWSRTTWNLDDLKSEASESFVRFVNTYPEWCKSHGVSLDNEGVFFVLAKKRIHWDIAQYIERRYPRGEEPLPDDSDVRTTLRVPHTDSALHHAIVASMGSLSLRERLMLALAVFEELSIAKMAPIFDTHRAYVGKWVIRASEKVLLAALGETLTSPVALGDTHMKPWAPPPQLTQWVRDHYDTDPETYLKYVEAHYHADVSYPVEILNRANGIQVKHDQGGFHSRAVTEAQIPEILARRQAGETYAAIAHDYGINEGTVRYINRTHGSAA